MKKRTVKVAVHKVFGIDVKGNQTVSTHCPAMDDLGKYLTPVCLLDDGEPVVRDPLVELEKFPG